MIRKLPPLFPVLAPFLLVTIFFWILSCATNPATGRSQLIFLSAEKEIALGREAHPQILSEYGNYGDSELSAWVKTLGEDMAAKTETPTLPFSFTVLDSPIINAFALPGGPTYITRGLLAHANDAAQVAGVVGHEIGHVVARHGAEQMSRAQLLQGALGVATIASRRVRQVSNLLGTGAQLLLLSNSRQAENEADRLGVRYAARAGYDPRGVAEFMRVLDRVADRAGASIPSWQSTHPDPGGRAERALELAQPIVQEKKERGVAMRRDRDAFFDRIDNMVFGDDPRQGFVYDGAFRHPEMGFRFDIPEGWNTVNTRLFFAATNAAQNPSARFVLRVVPEDQREGRTPSAYVERLRQENSGARFEGSATTVHRMPAWIGRIVVSGSGGGQDTLFGAWIDHGDTLYQFLGQWSAENSGAAALIEKSVRSFRHENDETVLAVKPVVIRFVEAGAGQTPQQVCDEHQELAVPCRDAVLINQLAKRNTPLSQRQKLKFPTRQSKIYP